MMVISRKCCGIYGTCIIVIIIILILLSSCDYFQDSISVKEVVKLEKILEEQLDRIDEAYAATTTNSVTNDLMKDMYGITAFAEYDDTSSESGVRSYQTIPDLDINKVLKLVSVDIRSKIVNLSGYRVSPGTIPRPLNSVQNGYWLSCSLDMDDIDTILGYKISNQARFSALFDDNWSLYEIRIAFEYGEDGELNIILDFHDNSDSSPNSTVYRSVRTVLRKVPRPNNGRGPTRLRSD